MRECKDCYGEMETTVKSDSERTEKTFWCPDCKKGFRWTMWVREKKLWKKLYEVL